MNQSGEVMSEPETVGDLGRGILAVWAERGRCTGQMFKGDRATGPVCLVGAANVVVHGDPEPGVGDSESFETPAGVAIGTALLAIGLLDAGRDGEISPGWAASVLNDGRLRETPDAIAAVERVIAEHGHRALPQVAP